MHTDVGNRLKLWRKSISKSQKDAASLLGIHPNTYQNYERGVRAPDSAATLAFANVGINANWLLTGEGEMLSAQVYAVNQPRAEYAVARPQPQIDVTLLTAIIAAVDMANPSLSHTERASIAAKAYAESLAPKASL